MTTGLAVKGTGCVELAMTQKRTTNNSGYESKCPVSCITPVSRSMFIFPEIAEVPWSLTVVNTGNPRGDDTPLGNTLSGT